MRLHQYDDIKKVNQSLGNFKRNGIKVTDFKLITVEGKVQFFVMADHPSYLSKPKKKEVKKDKVEKKAKVKETAKKEKTEKK